MKRAEDFPLTKHTLNLFAGDFQRLQEIAGTVGAGKIIRDLVRAYLNNAVSTGKPLHDLELTEETR